MIRRRESLLLALVMLTWIAIAVLGGVAIPGILLTSRLVFGFIPALSDQAQFLLITCGFQVTPMLEPGGRDAVLVGAIGEPDLACGRSRKKPG